jgi:heme O synthase-like polyprenyltransferase
LLPVWLWPTGVFYAACATVLGLVFILASIRFLRQPDRPHARTLFLTSIIYLPLILSALALDIPVRSWLGR